MSPVIVKFSSDKMVSWPIPVDNQTRNTDTGSLKEILSTVGLMDTDWKTCQGLAMDKDMICCIHPDWVMDKDLRLNWIGP